MVAATLLLALPAAAQGELSLRWSGCDENGTPNIVPECQFNIGERRLVMSIAPGADVADVVGWRLVLDYVSDVSPLPDWWQVQPGGCRQGQIAAAMPTGFEGDCADVWSATGSAVAQSYLYPRTGGDASQLRIIVGVGVPDANAFTLQAGQNYLAGILSLFFARTTTGECPGCETPVCFVFNSAEIVLRASAAGPPPGPFVTPSPAIGNSCTWGSGSSCLAVPVRGRTWGQIKALYR